MISPSLGVLPSMGGPMLSKEVEGLCKWWALTGKKNGRGSNMKGMGWVPGTGELGAAETQTRKAPKLWGGGRIKLVSLQLLKNHCVEPIIIPCMVLPLHPHLPNPVVILKLRNTAAQVASI